MLPPRPVTLITGASSGIGKALADVFADRGHALVLVARRAPELNAVADAVAARGRPRPQVIPIDLTSPEATARLERQLRDRDLAPQFVVNNAGFGLAGLAADLDRARQRQMIDLNARVLTDLSLRFVDDLVRHRGGILNVASTAAFMAGPQMAVYHATKAYVVSFSEAIHHELQPAGVRVTALCPGPIDTEFNARAGIPDDYFPAVFRRSAERAAREGYEGLMRGRRLVVPGSTNKVLVAVTRLLPRGAMLAMVRRFRPKTLP